MSIVIGDAVHTGASTPVVRPTTAPSASEIGSLETVLFGWLMISALIGRRVGIFRSKTILGPARVAADESPWLPVFLFFACYAVAGVAGPLLSARFHASVERRTFTEFHCVYGLFAILTLAAMSIFRAQGLSRLGLSARKLPRGILLGLLLIFAMFPVISVVSELTTLILHATGRPQPPPHQVLQAIRDNGADHVLIGLLISAAVLTAPFWEELLFRGCAQTAFSYGFEWMFAMMRPKPPALAAVRVDEEFAPGSIQVVAHPGPPVIDFRTAPPGIAARWCAILVAAAMFAAVHREWGFMPPLFVLAVGLGLAYEITGNLWVTIVAHASFNAAQILIFHAIG